MTQFINLVSDFFSDIFDMLASRSVDGVPILFLFLGAICISIVFNIFWKGAKG